MNFKKIISLAMVCVIAISAGSIVVNAEGTSTATSSKKILPMVKNKFENKDIRNNILEQKGEIKNFRASSTAQINQLREENKEKINDLRASSTEKMKELRASSTMMFKELKNQKKETINKMRNDVFQTRKAALDKELQTVLTNMAAARVQISSRITKAEGEGKNMSDAKVALALADDKLAKAKIAVDLFSNTTFVASTTKTSSSTVLTLDKPRKIGNDAIKAVKDARDALKKTVQTIAHTLGLKVEVSATTTTTTN